MTTLIILSMFALAHVGVLPVAEAVQDQVHLVNNAYDDVVIAINPTVPEDPALIQSIKDVMTDASQVLYVSTRKRAKYGKLKILVPSTWSKGNYSKTSTLNYDQSDIRVAPPSGDLKDEPYVIQRGGCGEFGLYMHITPGFLQNLEEDFGPRGKVIVHEWGHLRWGLFDEYAKGKDPPFYKDQNDEVQATRCSLSMGGYHMMIDYEKNTAVMCQLDKNSGLPEKNCRFVPDGSGGGASLMSHPQQHVAHFCHDDATDPANQHNSEAPNEQNRLCNLRSAWDVMSSSADFAGGANPSDPLLATAPTFEVLTPHSFRKFSTVLDVSGSMTIQNRLIEMRQSVKAFVEQALPQGDQVSVIRFSKRAWVLLDLMTVDSDADKQTVIDAIPSSATGSTCIGCGLQKGINSLIGPDGKAACGDIIVFTDGEENQFPYVSNVAPFAKEKKCTVHAVFLTSAGNENLKQLSIDTGGKWFFVLDGNVDRMIGAFSKIGRKNDGSDKADEAKQLERRNLNVKANAPTLGDVDVDKLVGNQTAFRFIYSGDVAPSVTLTTPGGCTYTTEVAKQANSCPGHPLSVLEAQFKTIVFTIPGIAPNGKWNYVIRSATDITVTMVATSKPSKKDAKPILVESSFAQAKKGGPVIASATVTRGGLPVVNLQVVASVQDPKGVVYNLNLVDDGTGNDIRQDDGTYTKAFTETKEPGRYSMEVSVTNGGKVIKGSVKGVISRAPFQFAVVEKGLIRLNPHGLKNKPEDVTSADLEDVGNFTRIDSAGGLEIETPADPEELTRDTLPPNPILNLVARQRDNQDSSKGVVLEFTAPGDDADNGKATRYEICYTFGPGQLLVRDFSSATCVNDTVEGNLLEPSASGTPERFVLPTPAFPEDHNDTIRIAYAVRAIDDVGNVAQTSNVVFIHYNIAPLVVEELSTVTFPLLTTTSQTTTTTGTTERPFTVQPGELSCLTCYNAKSYEDCENNGKFVLCQGSQRSCATEVRSINFGTTVLVSKFCKQTMACENNEQQNTSECRQGLSNSVCRCCCETDRCNSGSLCPER